MSTRKAFEKFMEGNIDNAYRFAYTFVKNKPDAEDILSESAVKALKAIKTLKDEKYLYELVENDDFKQTLSQFIKKYMK